MHLYLSEKTYLCPILIFLHENAESEVNLHKILAKKISKKVHILLGFIAGLLM